MKLNTVGLTILGTCSLYYNMIPCLIIYSIHVTYTVNLYNYIDYKAPTGLYNAISVVKHTNTTPYHNEHDPFTTPPFSQFRISPLGVVPTKTPGSYRLIHHLSYPRGASVNDGIAPEHSAVSYSRIDDAVGLIKQCGRGCFLAKTDIESAFRIIPIHPGDYCLLGMCWEGQYYYDRCMPVGCSSSCKTFESFSTALEWIAKHVLGVPHMIHLLDDFLLVSSTLAGCQARLAQFLALCTYLGVPIVPARTVGPFRVLSFAGIELDSVHMEADGLPHQVYMGKSSLYAWPFFRKGFEAQNCSEFVPIHKLVTVLLRPPKASQSLLEVLSGFSKYYPTVRVIFATEESVGAETKTKIASLGGHYENEVVSGKTQGALWKNLVQKVQTPYVLVAPNLNSF